jgi:hypothetical protein
MLGSARAPRPTPPAPPRPPDAHGNAPAITKLQTNMDDARHIRHARQVLPALALQEHAAVHTVRRFVLSRHTSQGSRDLKSHHTPITNRRISVGDLNVVRGVSMIWGCMGHSSYGGGATIPASLLPRGNDREGRARLWWTYPPLNDICQCIVTGPVVSVSPRHMLAGFPLSTILPACASDDTSFTGARPLSSPAPSRRSARF